MGWMQDGIRERPCRHQGTNQQKPRAVTSSRPGLRSLGRCPEASVRPPSAVDEALRTEIAIPESTGITASSAAAGRERASPPATEELKAKLPKIK